MTKLGSELQPGDTLRVWWGDHRDTIRRILPRDGDDPDMPTVARFISGTGMTIGTYERYEIVEDEA